MKKFCAVNNKTNFVSKIVCFLSVLLTLSMLTAYSYCDGEVGKSWPVYLKTPEHNSATIEEIRVPIKLKWKFFADKIFNPEELGEFRFYERNAFSGPPIVLNGKVFIRDNGGVLYAISLKSGKLLWKRNGQNHCYLAGDEKLNLIFSAPYQRYEIAVCALNSETGNVVWEKLLDTRSGRAPSQGGSSVSLTTDADAIIATVSSVAKDSDNIFRLNKTAGDIIWHQKADNSIKAPALLINNELIVLSKLNKFNADPSEYSITLIDKATGAILVKRNLGEIGSFPELSCMALSKYIITKNRDSFIVMLDQKSLESHIAKSFGSDFINTFSGDNDTLYLKRKGMVRYNIASDIIAWEARFETWGTAVPLVTKKHIFINSGSKIVAVNKETGKIEDIHNLDKYRSRFQIGPNSFDRNYIPTSFIAVDNTLLVACGDGGLYAFEGAKQN